MGLDGSFGFYYFKIVNSFRYCKINEFVLMDLFPFFLVNKVYLLTYFGTIFILQTLILNMLNINKKEICWPVGAVLFRLKFFIREMIGRRAFGDTYRDLHANTGVTCGGLIYYGSSVD